MSGKSGNGGLGFAADSDDDRGSAVRRFNANQSDSNEEEGEHELVENQS